MWIVKRLLKGLRVVYLNGTHGELESEIPRSSTREGAGDRGET